MATSKKSSSSAEGNDREGEAADQEASFLVRVWDQVGTLILAIVIALAIRAVVIEPFRIPSGSMLPTLLIGDHLFVNKFIYGARVPFTDWRLPGIREPRRGDVVVFEVARTPGGGIVPADRQPDLPGDDFIKRLVGLPGDRITARDGRLTINGVPMEQIDFDLEHRDELGRRLDVRTEMLEACGHEILDDPGLGGLQVVDFVVPEGRYFMMGDNRDYSNDSRQWGTVRLEEMKGPAFLLYWSWDVNGNALQFFNPLNWFKAEKRWDRVFSPVRCESRAEIEEELRAS